MVATRKEPAIEGLKLLIEVKRGSDDATVRDLVGALIKRTFEVTPDVEVLPRTPDIRLPNSTTEQRPVEQLVISVSRETISVGGEPVARIAELGAEPEGIIETLQTALRARAPTADAMPDDGLQVTILGDHELPYWLLKRIMQTCQSAEVPRISLAVNHAGGAEA